MNAVAVCIVAFLLLILYFIACYEVGCITEKIRTGWFGVGFWYALLFGPLIVTIPIIWVVAHMFNFKDSLEIQNEILNSQRAIRKKLCSH